MSSVSALPEAPPAQRPQPHSLTDLFLSFTLLALQGFGGVLAVVQRELVERKQWMTRDEFIEDWAVAQILPGPNVVNLGVMLGDRYFGWRGAVVSVLGLMLCPLFVVLALALVYTHFAGNPHVANALRGMGAVAAGLVTATGLKLASTLRKHPLGLPLSIALTVACFVSVAILKLPLIYVLFAIGAVACTLTYRKLSDALA
jgi:chromate transporter